jgi:phytoene dehydrogenase-like protein
MTESGRLYTEPISASRRSGGRGDVTARGRYDVVVVGGGLAGLTASATLAGRGLSVLVLERASRLGGRGGTLEEDGFKWNWGPHALYRRQVAAKVFKELGVRFTGSQPKASGGYGVYKGTKQTLPGGFLSLVSTGLFGLSGKMELARILSALPRRDADEWIGIPLSVFLAREVREPRVREFLCALVRLTSYTHAPEVMCAGSAIRQLQVALTANVDYVDGGWQVLVDALESISRAGGVEIRTGERVDAVEGEGGVRGVRLSSGELISADTVVIAGPPDVASALVSGVAGRRLAQVAQSIIPVRAACLDLALSSLPEPRALFALGIDRPLYFSVHSAYAKLAPGGSAVVHALRYLAPGESDAQAESELESLADLIQTGWCERLHRRRYLPSLSVTGAVVTASNGGLAGRQSPRVNEMLGLYVAGDWVGDRGMLADASVGSGYDAAKEILRSVDTIAVDRVAAA